MKLFKFTALILILLFAAPAYSQFKFLVGPSVGITLPEADYSGTTIDYYSGVKYGLSSGINVGAILKARLPILSIRVAANYSALSNTGVATSSNPGSYIEVKQKLFMISAGPEFYFNIPASPIKPYAGLDLLLSSISGETTFQGVPRVSTGTYSMSTTSRLGIGLGAGVEFGIGKTISLDLGLRYNMINLFGKSYEGGDSRIFSYLALNDAKDPIWPNDLNDHPIGNDRTISTLQFNLGILFGF